MIKSRRIFGPIAVGLAATALVAAPAGATHSWNGYHWARTSSPFVLQVGDNVSSVWDPFLVTTSADWSASTVVDTNIVAGRAGNPKRCAATAGRVEVCNAAYGNNGWLGIAQVWVSGTHITQGLVKMNDTYFKTSAYNTPAWRNLVMCQEVGHTLGLNHQDENFDNPNLGTCMDYTRDPSTNQHPNAHDYDQLVSIYNHTDSTSSVGSAAASSAAGDGNGAAEWGKAIRTSSDGRPLLYELHLGNGRSVFTFVAWAD